MNCKVEQSLTQNFNIKFQRQDVSRSPQVEGIKAWINNVESSKNVSEFPFLCSNLKPLFSFKVPQKKKIKKKSQENTSELEWTFKDYKILKGYLIIFPDDNDYICKLMNKFPKEEVHKRIEFLQSEENNKNNQEPADFCGFVQESNTKPLQKNNIFFNSISTINKDFSTDTTQASPISSKDELSFQDTLNRRQEKTQQKHTLFQVQEVQEHQERQDQQKNDFDGFYRSSKTTNDTLKMIKKMRKNYFKLNNEFKQFNRNGGRITHKKCSFTAIGKEYQAFKNQLFQQACQTQNIISGTQNLSSFC